MVAIENVVLAAVSVFALALTVISLFAFRRTRDAHLLFLAAAFGVFFVKGIVLTIALFSEASDDEIEHLTPVRVGAVEPNDGDVA